MVSFFMPLLFERHYLPRLFLRIFFAFSIFFRFPGVMAHITVVSSFFIFSAFIPSRFVFGRLPASLCFFVVLFRWCCCKVGVVYGDSFFSFSHSPPYIAFRRRHLFPQRRNGSEFQRGSMEFTGPSSQRLPSFLRSFIPRYVNTWESTRAVFR